MREWVLPAAAVAAVFCLVYLLYRSGFGVIQMKSAALYLGTPRLGKKRNRIEAKFASCNGFVKRVVRLPRRKRFRFAFSSNTTRGRVFVQVYGRGRELIAELSPERPCATISTDENNVFRVVIRFAKADGEYQLVWKKE